jgi:hypothetical protein
LEPLHCRRAVLAASAAGYILKLSARCIKGIADRYIHVLAGMVVRRIPADGDLVSWQLDIDAQVIEAPFSLVTMATFDDDSATHHSSMEALELVDALAHLCLDRLGRRHSAKGDLRRKLHAMLHRR